jgi:hypothetical protein
MRKLASVLVCVIAAFSLLAVSASATDYGFDPEYVIEVTGTVIEAADVSNAIEAAVAAGEAATIVLAEANTILSSDAISAIANAAAPVEFILPNGLSISIDPATITDNAVAINLNIDFAITGAGNQVEGVPANSIALFPSARGDFGFEVSINITAAQLAEAGLNGNNVRIFHVSDNVITDMGRVRLNADGSITAAISGASHYILSDQDIAAVAAEIGATVASTATAGTTDGDSNAKTGVILSFAGLGIAGFTALVAKKMKK